MNRLALFVSAVALLSASAAYGADLSGMKDNSGIPAATVNWSGLYAGINGGYAWDGYTEDASNAMFGGQLGVNVQRGNAVFGVETDLGWLNTDGDFHLGTVRGRVGIAMGNALVYGTGGYAYAGGCSGCFVDGWVAGTGAEYKLGNGLSLGAEWQHVELMPADPADVFKLKLNVSVAPF